MVARSEKTTNDRRDLECVLVGIAISATQASKEAIGQFGDNAFSETIAPVIGGIRNGNGKPLHSWLAERGAMVTEGRNSIEAVCERIHELNLAPRLRTISSKISTAIGTQNKAEVMEALKQAIEDLEALP